MKASLLTAAVLIGFISEGMAEKRTVAKVTCYSNENGGMIHIDCKGKGGAVYNLQCNEAPHKLSKSTHPLYLSTNACTITAVLPGCREKEFAVAAEERNPVRSLEPGKKYRIDLYTKTEDLPCSGTISLESRENKATQK